MTGSGTAARRVPCYDRADRGLRIVARQPQTTASERWVEQAQAGDVGAFEELYRQNVGRVHALCLRMCAAPDRAEEGSF